MDRKVSPDNGISHLIAQLPPIRTINGIHDLLTNLPSPSYFYEHVKRELAISERNRSPLHVVKIKLVPQESNLTESDYEVSLINFARVLSKISRAEDFISRMGKVEFIVIFHGTNSEIEFFTKRLADNVFIEGFIPKISNITYQHYEGVYSLMRRIDEAALVDLMD